MKTFVKKVRYIEGKKVYAEFDINNRFQKVYMIIAFIILFPIMAIACWSLEFARLCNIERKEIYVETKNYAKGGLDE